MVTDCQIRRLMMLIKKTGTLVKAADMSGMDQKTARKYLRIGRLPSQVKKEHRWRTRKDAFEEIWGRARELLRNNPGLQARKLFEHFQREDPGRFPDGQLRGFQRKVKIWRATEGQGKEVYFPQEYRPGEVGCSDFTHMGSLGITIKREAFNHLVFHFVLAYSNWETGRVCFSENYESLSKGLQDALWELGGVPQKHRTDNLRAGVYRDLSEKRFTPRYEALLKHYGLKGMTINAGCPHENGDVEQSHNRLKIALEQSLMLRGSKDFSDRQEYERFLARVFKELNWCRKERLLEELKVLRALPQMRLEDFKKVMVKVRPSSTITIRSNVYSVHSRLIGEKVEARLYSEVIEVWYANRVIESFSRLSGEKQHHIDYRHIIDWLVRKPGAFENYRYLDDLFPSTVFRMVYDRLREKSPGRASKEYLEILQLSAREMESEVERVLGVLLNRLEEISVEAVKGVLDGRQRDMLMQDVFVQEANLGRYDRLLGSYGREVSNGR